MKLAEALIRKAAITKMIPDRFCDWGYCSITSNQLPVKDPDLLLKELNDLMKEEEDLVKRINRTNCQPGPTGKKPSELIARRESLEFRRLVLRSLYNASQLELSRYSAKEIKLVSTVDTKSLQKQIDRVAKELRETILELQQLNWQIELLP